MRRLVVALGAIVVLALPAASMPATRITVYAASSLTGVFPRIDKAPRYSFAGSDMLAAQIMLTAYLESPTRGRIGPGALDE